MPQRELLTATTEQLASLPAWVRQRNQSATYPRAFMEAAVESGASREQLLQIAGVASEQIDDPAGRLSLHETWMMGAAALSLTGNGSLGFASGDRMPLTAHGNLGYALMCAGSPREAITILERFWHLRGRGARLMVSESENRLFMELVMELRAPDALRDMLMSSMLTSMYRGMEFLIPQLPEQREIWVYGPAPAGFDRWR
nr:AraC family transcriptional regulator [Oleiphilaceae bacterium]